MQELCSSLRGLSSGDPILRADEAARNLHGLDLYLAKVRREGDALRGQLPYLTWFLTGSLLSSLKRWKDSSVRRIACCLLKEVTRIALKHVPKTVAARLVAVPVRNAAVAVALDCPKAKEPCLQVLQMILEAYESG